MRGFLNQNESCLLISHFTLAFRWTIGWTSACSNVSSATRWRSPSPDWTWSTMWQAVTTCSSLSMNNSIQERNLSLFAKTTGTVQIEKFIPTPLLVVPCPDVGHWADFVVDVSWHVDNSNTFWQTHEPWIGNVVHISCAKVTQVLAFLHKHLDIVDESWDTTDCGCQLCKRNPRLLLSSPSFWSSSSS